MAFTLGNFTVKEIIFGVAQNFSDQLLYTLDQLTSASIEVSSDPKEVTDKYGNVVRSIYMSKTATFNSTSAMLSPALLNAASGSDIVEATATSAIEMPKILVVNPGATVDVSEAVADSIEVMGLFNNGANGKRLTASTAADYAAGTYAEDTTEHTITLPAAVSTTVLEGADKYFIKYNRNATSGMKLANYSNVFPDTIRLTLYAAIMDPCEDTYRAAYIYIPSFQPDPSVTISLDVDNQEVDYKGNINVDFCGNDKALYFIYFPDEEAVVTAATNA